MRRLGLGVMVLLFSLVSSPPSLAQRDYDCADFDTWSDAQDYFDAHGGSRDNDVDNLDADHDGIACEWLPDPFHGREPITSDQAHATEDARNGIRYAPDPHGPPEIDDETLADPDLATSTDTSLAALLGYALTAGVVIGGIGLVIWFCLSAVRIGWWVVTAPFVERPFPDIFGIRWFKEEEAKEKRRREEVLAQLERNGTITVSRPDDRT